MSLQPTTDETLEEMQERLAQMQRDYRDFVRENSKTGIAKWYDIQVLVAAIEDKILAGAAPPQQPAPPATSDPLQSPATVPSLSLVAQAKLNALPHTPRKVPRPSLIGLPSGRPIESNHPFPRAVKQLKAWATAHGLHYSAVKSWYTTGITWRPIPRKWAELLARDWGVPLKAWKGRQMRVINRRTGHVRMVWRDGISDDHRGGKPHPGVPGLRARKGHVTP